MILNNRMLLLLFVALININLVGCAAILGDKSTEGSTEPQPGITTQTVDLEQLIIKNGFEYESFFNGQIFVLPFATDEADFSMIIQWDSEGRNYVSLQLVLINQPNKYVYSDIVLRELNRLNVEYKNMKFIADKASGDIQIVINLDARLLDADRLKNAITVLVFAAEKEFQPMVELVLKDVYE